ncbi:hypothetical protein GA0116948_105243 [Chitinophaga costaii]|uniref:Uncharacterized protein n=1 Tax=Chitinophaga costaii TaxID=1335309 RepID=A0A1C4DF49_9BACT|nr:hypothetical protein [Chitinophaga costaii]PUZ24602.1 hypothetical protein DCM91_11960 [Chitinophaga costaii]SCC30002.1 hypothetical protein GA0116948_105243 [Chitinophaga costaii]
MTQQNHRPRWSQLIHLLHPRQAKPNRINFTTRLEARDIPVPLQCLAPRLAKTHCVGLHRSILLQSSYDNQGLPLGMMQVYNNGLPPQAPKMLEDIVALVCCLYGGANCNIVGEGPLHFRQGRYYFTRVKNDYNECHFFPGLSVYYYVLLPPWLVEQLLTREAFMHSGVLQALYQATQRNKTVLIDMPHQVITEPMAQLLALLQRLPLQDEGQEQVIFNKTVALVEEAITQAGRGNAHIPPVSHGMDELFTGAEAGYREQLRQEALMAWCPAWVLAGWRYMRKLKGMHW